MIKDIESFTSHVGKQMLYKCSVRRSLDPYKFLNADYIRKV